MDPQVLVAGKADPTSTATPSTSPVLTLTIDVVPEVVTIDVSRWRSLPQTHTIGADFRILEEHRLLVWEWSAASIDAEMAATTTVPPPQHTHAVPSHTLVAVVSGLEDSWKIVVRYEHIPHWFEWCRVRGVARKPRLPRAEIQWEEFDNLEMPRVRTVISLQERSLLLLRKMGVGVSIDPEEGIVFDGRKIAGAEEIARVLVEDAIRKDDAELLETVHYTLLHSRLLYLTQGALAQIILHALKQSTETSNIELMLCEDYAELGEKAIVGMIDIDRFATENKLDPARLSSLRSLLQDKLCAHKQDLRDGTVVS